MELSALAGNSRIKEQLAHREGGRGLAHAYIISGAVGSGRHTLAGLLSAAMVCQAPEGRRPCGKCAPCRKQAGGIHPDIIRVAGPEGKPISVDQVRSLRTDAHIRPNEAQRKIYLLEKADRMNPSAQNAMLKLLEEGPAYAVFLLLADNEESLLPTIRSRCEVLALTPVTPAQGEEWLRGKFPKESPEKLKKAAVDCQGVLGRAVSALSGGDEADRACREQAAELAEALENGDELTLFEKAMPLDKLDRDALARLLEETLTAVGRRAPDAKDKGRMLNAAQLLRTLRGAVELNANAGQIAGWLCAGMFQEQDALRPRRRNF